ncbi:MAG: M48 family metallopeptidase [Sphingomonadaceae bacterium]
MRKLAGMLVSPVLALALVAQPLLSQTSTVPSSSAASSIESADKPYHPTDKDERGLWMQVEEYERQLKISPLVIRDPDLNGYVRSVLCRSVGQAKCAGVRIYILRTPDFNANMSPNGMMQVYSGLLLRMRNEAQLASVLGHEFTHYEKNHTLQLFRDVRSRSNANVWLSMIVGGLISSLLTIPGLYQHSRDMEREADQGGFALLAKAGYDTREAAKIWEQLREEMDATAIARKTKSRKDMNGGMFATHPPSAERVANLSAMAGKESGTAGNTGAEAYAKAMTHFWPLFVDDQLKLNDFGGSEYLVTSLGKQGWTDWLYYARGELYRRRAGEGDLEKAVGFFTDGMTVGSAMPELWRGRGLARLKLSLTEDGKADLREYLKRSPNATDKAMIAMMAGG